MASLNGQSIASTYPSLLKFVDNAAATTTPKNITDGSGAALPMEVATDRINFTDTIDFTAANVLGISGGGSEVNALSEYTFSRGVNNSFYLNAWSPIIPFDTSASFPNANAFISYNFGTSNPLYVYQTDAFKEGQVINEIEFYTNTASADFDQFVIAIHDSYINANNEIDCGPMLTQLTSNAALIQTTGWKNVTGINYTVPASTSGTGIYFITVWAVSSVTGSSSVKIQGGPSASRLSYVSHYSSQTQWVKNGSYGSNTGYSSYPTTGNIDLRIGQNNNGSSVPVIGFK